MVGEKGSDIQYQSSNLPDTPSEVSAEVSDTPSRVSDIRTLSSFYGLVSEVHKTWLMGGGLEIIMQPLVTPTLPDTNCIDPTVNPTLQDTNLEVYLQHNISFIIPTILQDVKGVKIDPSFLQGKTVTYSTKRIYKKTKDEEGVVYTNLHTKGSIYVHTGDFHGKEFFFDLG